jgi:hypothetical protein
MQIFEQQFSIQQLCTEQIFRNLHISLENPMTSLTYCLYMTIQYRIVNISLPNRPHIDACTLCVSLGSIYIYSSRLLHNFKIKIYIFSVFWACWRWNLIFEKQLWLVDRLCWLEFELQTTMTTNDVCVSGKSLSLRVDVPFGRPKHNTTMKIGFRQRWMRI